MRWLFGKKEKKKEETAEEFVKELKERIRHIEEMKKKEKVAHVGLWTVRLEYDEVMERLENKPWIVYVLSTWMKFVDSVKFEKYEDALKFFKEVKKALKEEVEE